jgi:dihydroorotate dehydrogenase
MDGMAEVLNRARIDGVIVGNTTVDRSEIAGHKLAGEAGGRSGAPLYQRATTALRKMRLRLDDSIPIIGVGGITSGADACGKIAAGAKLVQFYSGMVFRGPELVQECVASLLRLREGVK